MCGVWGFSAFKGRPSQSIIHEIIKLADERGGHSYGLFAVDNANKTHIVKGDGRINSGYVIELLKNCRLAIGHSRLATYGSRSLSNAQPLILQDYVIAHNGNIPDYKDIMQKKGYTPVTTVDSEAIACIIGEKEKHIKGAYLAIALNSLEGIISYSNEYPLYENTSNGVTYYCSKKWETT